MLQYLITGLAGLALGIVGKRLWMVRTPAAAGGGPGGAGADTAVPSFDQAEGASDPGRFSARHLLLGAGAIAAIAAAILFTRATDQVDAGSSPVAPAAGAASGKQLDDVDTMISRLAARLEKEPNDGEGFRMLGWSYLMTSRPEQAIEPFKRAMALLPQSALVHSGYGEALVGVAKGAVTTEAREQFNRTLALDPKEPRARYFLALWQAQNGQPGDALDKWIELANSGQPDAPWQTELRQKIAETSAKLGVDVSKRLKIASPAPVTASAPQLDPAAMQAAGALPEGDRAKMVDGMVEGLAAKLKANPRDADRWVLMLRSRMVLKQSDRAHDDLITARKALAGDAAGLSKVNAAARDLAVPGA